MAQSVGSSIDHFAHLRRAPRLRGGSKKKQGPFAQKAPGVAPDVVDLCALDLRTRTIGEYPRSSGVAQTRDHTVRHTPERRVGATAYERDDACIFEPCELAVDVHEVQVLRVVDGIQQQET